MCKRIFQLLPIAIIVFIMVGCTKQGSGTSAVSNVLQEQTDNTGNEQTDNTGNEQTDNTGNEQTDNTGNEQTDNTGNDIVFCNPGDILTIGQSCLDKGTDATFKVLDNKSGSYTSESGLLFESTDVLETLGSTLNGRSYNFKAVRVGDGMWQIETTTSQ